MPHSISCFRITFYNKEGRFQEGNTLAGSVKFAVQETIAISRLEIRFKGLSNVFWHKAFEKNLQRSKNSVFKFYDSEQYLNQKLNLLISNPASKLYKEDHSESLIFLPQEYIFPFSVQLPDSLPPTFLGDYGEVKYMTTAEVLYYSDPSYSSSTDLSIQGSLDEEEGNFLKCWKEFLVEKVLPLTDDILKPKEVTLTKRHHLMILRLNDIRCNWKLKKGGFLPGEDMDVSGNIENLGRIKVLKAKIVFIQHIVYKSQKCSENYIYQRKKLASKTKTSIPPDACGYLREKIHIPVDIQPTNQNKGELINIKYSVKLTIVLQSPFKSMKSEIEIVIGTVDSQPGRSNVKGDLIIDYPHNSYFV